MRAATRSAEIAAGGVSILLLVLQPVLFYWRVLVNPRAYIPFDIEGFHLPLISYMGQCLRRGVAPLWDPYPYCGVPIHADVTAAVFYPFTWLAVLAGNHSQGRNLFYWVQALDPLHMILAGLFAFLLLRRMGLCRPAALLGATVYQLGGYFASQAQHLGAICAGAWLPLAILAVFELKEQVRARWIAILAITVAMSILSGFVAATLVVAGAVALVMLALLLVRDASWRMIPSVAAGFLGGAIISVVELVPLWGLSHASLAGHRPIAFGTGGGMTWYAMVSLVSPNYFHIFDLGNYKLPYNFTYLYVYCGIATVILILLAPLFRKSRAPVFLALTIVSAVWMLGDQTPVYPFLFVHLPVILRSALYPEFALMAFCCFAGITAALVLDRIGTRVPQAVLWAVALFTSYDLIHTGSGRPMNSAPGGYKSQDSEYGIADRAPALLPYLRTLVAVDNPPSRIDYTDTTFQVGFLGSEMLRLPTANGDNPFVLTRILRLRWLFATARPWDRQLSVNRPGSPILSMLNVGWLASGSELAPDQVRQAGLEFEKSLEGLWVYRNPRALPRFFLAPHIRRSSGEEETFRLLADPAFDPHREAIVEGIPQDRESAGGEIKVRRYAANRIQLSVTASGPAFLATSEPMYTGWEATVNGRKQSLQMTNGAFRGLALPSGTSDIVMEYHPPHLLLWLFISLISFVGALAVSLRVDRFRPREAVAEIASKKEQFSAWLRQGTGKAQSLWRAQVVPRQSTIKWLSFLLLATVLFYWRILLTRQFSLLTELEGVTQAYSWLRFWTASIRHGFIPVWDPYTLAGHSFVGEMQTAAFYPLHLLLALFPLNRAGVFSPRLYHVWFAFAHFLGACFMYALAREFRLSRFASFLAGICFSLGGFVAGVGWPHMLESAIWLPLLFLFTLRALRAFDARGAVLNAAIGALMLGLSILAGGMHIVILQALVVVSACAYDAFGGESHSWRRAALVIAIVGTLGFAAGAVQLAPSMEYSARAIRFLGKPGALPATEKIPYQDLSDGLWPNAFVSMLMPYAFDGHIGGVEVINPYLGVFPLLLAILGIWRNWAHRWVRYLTGLTLAAFLYSLGAFSLLHGILYAVVPRLWMAREAGRIVYLADFAISILVAFGVDSLLSSGFRALVSTTLNRILAGIVIACAAALFVPALFGRPQMNLWIMFSIVLIFLSYALYRYIARGNIGGTARLLMAGLILFDLSAFDWTARNLIEVSRTGINHRERLLSTRGAVDFLRLQPGPFRVEVAGDAPPNIADSFGIPTTNAAGVTMPVEFLKLKSHADLLNVRYRLMPASTSQPGAVYQDSAWKVYEVPSLPRAWVVHEAVVEPSPERALARLESAGFDPGKTAVLDSPVPLDPAVKDAPEGVIFSAVEPHRLELRVVTPSHGLLVVSEMFYPGWYATVNAQPARIYRADTGLRGIAIPPGESRITLEYAPRSVYGGALLTFLAFFGTLAALWWRRRVSA